MDVDLVYVTDQVEKATDQPGKEEFRTIDSIRSAVIHAGLHLDVLSPNAG